MNMVLPSLIDLAIFYHHHTTSRHATSYLPPLFLNFVMIFWKPSSPSAPLPTPFLFRYSWSICICTLWHSLLVQYSDLNMSQYPTVLDGSKQALYLGPSFLQWARARMPPNTGKLFLVNLTVPSPPHLRPRVRLQSTRITMDSSYSS